MWKEVRFIKTAAKIEDFPKYSYPEIAIVGRSNVGKSSLINHLLRKKDLAKVSSTPGKTKLLQFFLIEERLSLVDLPGYGFAKASREEQKYWTNLIEGYLFNRASLKVLIHIVDSRHLPSKEDIAMQAFAKSRHIKTIIVLSKTDKLSKKELDENPKAIIASLQATEEAVLYSIKDAKGRDVLIRKIEEYI